MQRAFNNSLIWCSLFSFEIDEVDFEKYKAARGLYIEDPWERVKTIFKKDDFGSFHPELVHAIQNTQIGLLAGFLYGGGKADSIERENFIRNTEAEIFANKKEAYKSLNNFRILAFGKGGLKWAPKFGFFFGSFSLISSCCMLYRNKQGILENTLAGTFTGALCKFSFGLKGLLSGGIFGGLLGTFYGITLWGIQKITKKDQIELKYAQFAYMKYRERLKNTSSTEEKPLIHKIQNSHISHINNPLNNFDVEEKEVEEKEEEKKI